MRNVHTLFAIWLNCFKVFVVLCISICLSMHIASLSLSDYVRLRGQFKDNVKENKARKRDVINDESVNTDGRFQKPC